MSRRMTFALLAAAVIAAVIVAAATLMSGWRERRTPMMNP